MIKLTEKKNPNLHVLLYHSSPCAINKEVLNNLSYWTMSLKMKVIHVNNQGYMKWIHYVAIMPTNKIQLRTK